MPISRRYRDIYEVIICYITNHLDPTNYRLNFSVIALHEIRPKVIIRFTLKNTRNNMKKSWTQLLEGEMLEDLFDSVYETVEANKLEVWLKSILKVNVNVFLLLFLDVTSIISVRDSKIINIFLY